MILLVNAAGKGHAEEAFGVCSVDAKLIHVGLAVVAVAHILHHDVGVDAVVLLPLVDVFRVKSDAVLVSLTEGNLPDDEAGIALCQMTGSLARHRALVPSGQFLLKVDVRSREMASNEALLNASESCLHRQSHSVVLLSAQPFAALEQFSDRVLGSAVDALDTDTSHLLYHDTHDLLVSLAKNGLESLIQFGARVLEVALKTFVHDSRESICLRDLDIRLVIFDVIGGGLVYPSVCSNNYGSLLTPKAAAMSARMPATIGPAGGATANPTTAEMEAGPCHK